MDAGAFLDQLRKANQDLFAEIRNMDVLTSSSRPNAESYAAARWRISLTSLQRRRLSFAVRNSLLSNATAQEHAALKSLQEREAAAALRTRSHIAAWPIQSVLDDWPGYCAASRTLRRHMSEHISFEEGTIYTMLERRMK